MIQAAIRERSRTRIAELRAQQRDAKERHRALVAEKMALAAQLDALAYALTPPKLRARAARMREATEQRVQAMLRNAELPEDNAFWQALARRFLASPVLKQWKQRGSELTQERIARGRYGKDDVASEAFIHYLNEEREIHDSAYADWLADQASKEWTEHEAKRAELSEAEREHDEYVELAAELRSLETKARRCGTAQQQEEAANLLVTLKAFRENATMRAMVKQGLGTLHGQIYCAPAPDPYDEIPF
jgi:plasmid stability protein